MSPAGATARNIVSLTTALPPPTDDKGEQTGAGMVVEYVSSHYDLGCTPDGEAYAVPRQGARIPVPLSSRGGRLRDEVCRRLYAETKRVPGGKAVDDAFRVIVAQARAVEVRVPLHLRVAEHGGALVLDLAEPASARCAVVTAEGWTVEDSPPAGVLFRRTSASHPLPAPVRGGSFAPLCDLLGLGQDDPRYLLCRGWLVAACFPSAARPLLGLLGAPGSAKTTRGKALVSVVDPRDELGGNFGRRLDDDQVKALGRYLVSYDNVTSVSEAVSDHLCRLVTGEQAEKRMLHSDADLVTITYRRTGVLTAVALPSLRPDALERVVVLALDRIPEAQRRPEAAMAQVFAAAHPAILGALLDALVGTLARLPAVRASDRPRSRMADYDDLLTAYDPACAQAYRDAVADVMSEAAEADPFVVTVRAWLAGVGGTWTGTPADAWEQAARVRTRTPGNFYGDAWWPKSGSHLSRELTKATEPLRAVGIEVERIKRNGVRLLTLRTGTAQGRQGTATATAVPGAVPDIAAGQAADDPF